MASQLGSSLPAILATWDMHLVLSFRANCTFFFYQHKFKQCLGYFIRIIYLDSPRCSKDVSIRLE